MTYYIVDIESDYLLEEATKIHCVSVFTIDTEEESKLHNVMITITNYEEMRRFFNSTVAGIIVGHNFMRFDKPLVKKILGVEIKCKILDSLAFSWYLFPKRATHNLEDWGRDLGTEKPYIEDWQKLSLETYIQRCEADTHITKELYWYIRDTLNILYNNDQNNILRIIGYIQFKMDCAAEQENVKWKLDKPKCETNLQELFDEVQPRIDTLSAAMPLVTIYKNVARPNTLLKKDGSVSVAGEKWFAILKEMDLPEYYTDTVKYPTDKKIGNPNSHKQIKDWLFSLGWVPDYFKYVKEPDGTNRPVPQVNNQEGDDLSESVKILIEKEPALEVLDGLTKLKHRISLLEAFLSAVDKDSFVKAEISGLTNTLRFQHAKPCVNLPTIFKAYGKYVREVLIAPTKDHILCGSDMSGIEEATKHHYMSFYYPEDVKKIRTKGFDPHLNLCVEARLITVGDMDFYKQYEKDRDEQKELFSPSDVAKTRYKYVKDIRVNKGKKTNFGAIYGAGPAKISLTSGMAIQESSLLHKSFWIVNKAVKLVAKHTIVKTLDGQMWLWNPVSKFWYSLRATKDKFSTLNQGTAVYCFDTQVRNVRKHKVKMCGQFHDEWVAPLLAKNRDKLKAVIEQAIIETNAELRLNVELGISIEFGKTYADIH